MQARVDAHETEKLNMTVNFESLLRDHNRKHDSKVDELQSAITRKEKEIHELRSRPSNEMDDSVRDQISQLQREIAELRGNNSELHIQLDSKRMTINELEDTIRQKEKLLEDIEARYQVMLVDLRKAKETPHHDVDRIT